MICMEMGFHLGSFVSSAEEQKENDWEEKKTYVKILDDDSQAFLFLMPKMNDIPYTKEEIIDLLRMNGVVAGIIESNVAAIAKKGVYEREIKVADAIVPKEGVNGYYEYFFDVTNSKKAPKIREDGSVDYQSMNILQNVKVGDTIAIYHNAVMGVDGVSVRGTKIPAALVKELPTLKGKGFIQKEDDLNIYIAQMDGKIDYVNDKISINKIHQISGDVDLITGKIEFYGDVLITGNVEAGVVIKAGKTLTIEGTVESAYLFAGEDIVLKRGIQGNNKGKVVAKGNFYADFVERTQLQVGMNVEANIIMNSQIDCGGKIIVKGKKGFIIGGEIHATKGIDCKGMGNDAEVKTIAHAGVLPEIIQKYKTVIKEEKEVAKILEEVLTEMQKIILIKKDKGTIPLMLEQRLLQLRNLREEHLPKLSQCRKEESDCLEIMEKAKGASIRVDGNIYRNCLISIDNNQMFLDKGTAFMEYRNLSGMIVGSVIISV